MTIPVPKKKAKYDCSKCPGYCCSVYEIVEVDDKDIERLGRHFGIPSAEAAKKFTRLRKEGRVLKRKADPLLGSSCRFLDLKTRRCSIYEARPDVCRDFPPVSRCTFYDLLEFQRRHCGDEEMLPVITMRGWKRVL
ncbi:MAG: YkgJ family cysteine cluster protein [Acidobacteriota bacterium]